MALSTSIALAGNPNSGKTTLFNALTGARQKVGNWPGVTVEKKEGTLLCKGKKIKVVDLPGIYSLSPYSLEEVIARDYMVDELPDVIVNIVDASNIERNLYLSMQIMELGRPVVIALNMMDIARGRGYKIDVAALSRELGVPVIPIVASEKTGLDELLDTIEHMVSNDEIPVPHVMDFGKEVERIIDDIKGKIQSKPELSRFNSRWLALKMIEGDERALQMAGSDVLKSTGIEDDEFEDMETIIADRRYSYILGVISKSVYRPRENQESGSDRIDMIVTNRWLGIPIFAGIMYFVFWLTFNIGNVFLDLIDGWFSGLAESAAIALEGMGVDGWLVSLISDGIIAGVGGVLTFLPNIVFLFLAISILEDSGYMARVAFIMDRVMRRLGLSGKSFIPMIIGFGCTVPAIMAARTLEEENDRLTTILVAPFMSCGARLPIYILFAGVFFPGSESKVVFSLYLLGIVVAVAMALIFKRTIFKSDMMPFIMELPPYRMPSVKTTGMLLWEKVKGYIVKAGTVIFAASILIWFILNFGPSGMTEMNESIGAAVGKLTAPLFAPLGFGSWQASLSLITGLLAKEAVVSSMAVIYGLGETVGEAAMDGDVMPFISALTAGGFTQLSAYAFMVFSLLYTPCLAVIGVVKRETGSWKWTGFSVAYQFAVAWIVALVVYQIGSMLGF